MEEFVYSISEKLYLTSLQKSGKDYSLRTTANIETCNTRQNAKKYMDPF